jgi:thioredoxin-like negative regulator of GroEL
MRGKRWRAAVRPGLIGAALAAAVGLAAWRPLTRAAERRRFEAEIERARGAMDRGDFATAARRLTPLSDRRPGRGDLAYWLGVCEDQAGRTDRALAAWSRVPARPPFGPLAALRRAPLEREQGRLADAERSLTAALDGTPDDAHAARHQLAEVFWQQGRFDEARTLVEVNSAEASGPGWPDPGEADGLLRFLLALALNPLPIDRLRDGLDRAGALAPDDDRVWLGRAHLALRTGDLGAAAAWLGACRSRRPGDPAVWRAALELAVAADRPGAVSEVAAHLRDVDLPPARVEALRAWLAARRGDPAAERGAWERVAALDPGDPAALDRLAALALAAGRPDEAAGLRRRKATLDDALHRYRGLFRDGDLARDAAEMGRLAERLGRWFEARALRALAAGPDLGEPGARAAADRPPAAPPRPAPPAGRPLAEVLAADLAPARPRPGPEAAAGVTPRFHDDAEAAGLTFVHEPGTSPRHQLPEAMGGGVGLLDYDGDGRLDVYAVQGGEFPPGPSSHGGDRLFRNRGDGTFEDVTHRAGLADGPGGYGHGVAVGDVDNDGRPDLFVTRWRAYALYHNRGDGTFEDITARAGLDGDRDWPTSAAFADLDNDGDLDLYVCHYLAWDPDDPAVCQSPSTGRPVTCDPRHFRALPDHVFRNAGGRFTDVTAEAGLDDRDGRGLGVVAADLDGDGRTDLYVANDGTANYLYCNRGGFRFAEVGHDAGAAAGAAGGYQAGMGVACGDLDGDGRPDLAVTNFLGESTTLYGNLGGGAFLDRTASSGLAAPSRYRLGFGVAFLDADDDGRPDLMTANGHIADERPEVPFAMPAQLLRGAPGGRLVDVSSRAGEPFRVPRLGRGLAAGDLDNDGRVDAVVVGQAGPLGYFHNVTEGEGRSLTLALEGTASNRDGVGAVVTVVAGGRRQVAQRTGGGSYQAAGDPRLHFGLGAADRVDEVEVRWPSGRTDRHRQLAAGRGYRLREGAPEPAPLEGWPHGGPAAGPEETGRGRPPGRDPVGPTGP